jgi:hypothetical protein
MRTVEITEIPEFGNLGKSIRSIFQRARNINFEGCSFGDLDFGSYTGAQFGNLYLSILDGVFTIFERETVNPGDRDVIVNMPLKELFEKNME